MEQKKNKKSLSLIIIKSVRFLCGVENDGTTNRTALWTMLSAISTIVVLLLAFDQLQDVNETTSAEFAHKIKNDLYTDGNLRLSKLFDADVLIFRFDTGENSWFELDSIKYNKLSRGLQIGKVPVYYSVYDIDALLQDFEDLALFEKRRLIKIEYIYIQYAYFIEMLWENKQIESYIKWLRKIPHFGNSYKDLEALYLKVKAISDKDP